MKYPHQEIIDVLREEGFTLSSRSHCYNSMNFTTNTVGGLLLSVDNCSTFTLSIAVDISVTITYSTMSIKFIMEDTPAWSVAKRKMRRLHRSSIVQDLRDEYIERRLNS